MNRMAYRFARWCPGAAGLWLRRKLFPRLFRSCGRGVLFGRFVDCIDPGKIRLGERVVLHNGAVLDAGRTEGNGPAIVLADDVFVGAGTQLRSGEGGSITVGEGANFSSFCSVMAGGTVTIGKKCLVAAYCEVGGSPAGNDAGLPSPDSSRAVRVEDGCWLGVRARVRPGVTIGRDTIVGAHAEVDQDLLPLAVAVGRPARVIRHRREEQS